MLVEDQEQQEQNNLISQADSKIDTNNDNESCHGAKIRIYKRKNHKLKLLI